MASLNDIVKQIVSTLRADGKIVTKAVAHIVAETVFNPETGKFFAEGPIDENSGQIVVQRAVQALKNTDDITFMTLMMQISNPYLTRIRDILPPAREPADGTAARHHERVVEDDRPDPGREVVEREQLRQPDAAVPAHTQLPGVQEQADDEGAQTDRRQC